MSLRIMSKFGIKLASIIVTGCFIALSIFFYAHAANVPTTVTVTICGDGIVQAGEICDYGSGLNTGAYSTSTVGRICNSSCTGYGPYCGDSIMQVVRGEECDDGNNVSGDFCSAICKAETPTTSGGGGSVVNNSGGGIIPTSIPTLAIINGKAYPNTEVNVLLDSKVLGVARADTKGNFSYTLNNASPGPSTFGFWAKDRTGLKSITLNTTLEIVQNAATTISGIFLPPTLIIHSAAVKIGSPIIFSGETVPDAIVSVRVGPDDSRISTSSADTTGLWQKTFSTDTLENDKSYAVKTLFSVIESGNLLKSVYGESVIFTVGDKELAGGGSSDINRDNKIDLVDFSILLFHWGSTDITSDLNQDGIVNLTDFSILLFNWTG